MKPSLVYMGKYGKFLSKLLNAISANVVFDYMLRLKLFKGHFDEELVIPIIDNEREDYLLVEKMTEALRVIISYSSKCFTLLSLHCCALTLTEDQTA